VRCAQARHESRGLHFSRDHPETLAEAHDTVLDPEARSSVAAPLARAAGT